MTNLLSLRTKKSGGVYYALLLGLLLLLVAVGVWQQSGVPTRDRWSSVEGGRIQESEEGETFPFGLRVDENLIAGDTPLTIKASGEVISGRLGFELRAPDGRTVWNSGTINPGGFSINKEYHPPVGQTGMYTLGMVYSANTEATYNLGWQAVRLGPLVLLPGLGMIMAGLAFIVYASQKRLLNRRYLGLGALFWLLTVAIKFTVAAWLNPLAFQALEVNHENLFVFNNLIAYLYVGALTGVFEVGLAWLILSKVRWGKANWNQALSFGIGFGVFEALLLGLAGFGSALVAFLGPDTLPVSVLGGLANDATVGMGLAPIIERLGVIFVHIFTCVLIFYAIASGETRWGWLALLFKTGLDAVAGFAAFWGANTLGKIWALEAIILVFGLLGLWGTRRIAQRYRQLTVEPANSGH